MSANMAFCHGLQSLSERRLQREDSMPAEAPICRGTQRFGWESEEADLCDYVQFSDDEPSASVPPAPTASVNEIPAVDIANDGVDDTDAKNKKPASDDEPHVSLPATPTESFQEIPADFRVAHEGENKSLASTTPEGIIAPVDSANDGVEDADAKHNHPASGGSQYKEGDICFYQGMAATVTSVTQHGGKSVLELQLDGQNGVRAAMVPDVKPRCPGQTPPTCQGLGVQPAQGGGGTMAPARCPCQVAQDVAAGGVVAIGAVPRKEEPLRPASHLQHQQVRRGMHCSQRNIIKCLRRCSKVRMGMPLQFQKS